MKLLDTSFLIRALVRGTKEERALRSWIRKKEPVAASTVAWAEFLCGPLDAEDYEIAAAVLTRQIEFDRDDALLAGQLFNDTGRRRGTLIDCMIAATAVRVDADLATANPTDFQRFEPLGLRIEVV